jgi:N-acetylglucosaminyldiphosphoundecaprenol N-acetyl-beta-D-mannosaminyltransferase
MAMAEAMADLFQSDVAPDFALPDDLSREVYCILGVPVDAIGMHAVLRRIGSASTAETPFLISTPNLNSLVISQLDREFKMES